MKASARGLLSAVFLAACAPTPAPDGAGSAVPATAAPATAAAPLAPASVGPDGPTTIALPPDFEALLATGDAAKGEALYASKGCKACHNLDATRLVGPGFAGVAGRHSVTWMARMMLKPEVMIAQDPAAKKLLGTYMVPMANQAVDPKTELPHLLAFLLTKK